MYVSPCTVGLLDKMFLLFSQMTKHHAKNTYHCCGNFVCPLQFSSPSNYVVANLKSTPVSLYLLIGEARPLLIITQIIHGEGEIVCTLSKMRTCFLSHLKSIKLVRLRGKNRLAPLFIMMRINI